MLFTCTGAPQLLVVSPMNSTVVNVSWSEIQCFNGSGAVAHYIVQYQSLYDGAVQNVTTSGLVQTVSGLEPNCVYTFQVAAVGAGDIMGPFSNPVNVSLPGECRDTLLLNTVTSVMTIILISVAQYLGGNM